MTTPNTDLQEQIARAIRLAGTGDSLPPGFAERMWDAGVTNRDKEMRLAAAVLPIVDAAVKRGQAEAWEKGWGTAIDQAPGDVWFDEWHYQTNPYHEETP